MLGTVPQAKEIALAFPRGGHLELLIEGVLSYERERELNWCYITALEFRMITPLDLVDWKGDGVLAAINTEEEAACAETLGIPIVNISSALGKSPVPCCVIDNYAMGVMAAEHLLSKGFRSYAYLGLKEVEYSTLRYRGFSDKLAEAGFSCVPFESYPTYRYKTNDWLLQNHELAEWLDSLEKPLGLFAVSDYRARQAMDSCRLVGLKIPEEVAVVGTGNEDLVCEHVHPTITSIARNNHLQGYRAAELLDNLMQGKPHLVDPAPIPPLEIVERDSTQTFAVADPRLRQALEYLHDHLHEPLFSIEDVTRQAGVSRRWLEYAFRDSLGETPYQYLRRQRLARARRLLVEEPKTKIYKIAQCSGFSSAKQLAMTFQQDFGMSPREYRRSSQS